MDKRREIVVLTVTEFEDVVESTVNRIVKKIAVEGIHNFYPQKEIFTVPELRKFLGLARQTIYGLTSRNQIPYFKKGNKVYFRYSEIIKWLEEGRRMSESDIDEMVNNYFQNK